MRAKSIAIIATLMLSISSSSSVADNFPATRYPFQPNLLINNNPPLCKAVLREAKLQFFQNDTDGILFSDETNGFEWLEWDRPSELQSENANIDRIDLDLDGGGEMQIVLMHSFTHSWRGDNFYAFVFKNANELKKSYTTPTDLVNRLSAIEYSLPNKAPYDTPVRYYPDALASSTSNADLVNTGSNWQVNRLFRWNKRYYFFDEKNPFIQLTQEQQAVYRLRGDGKVELQCRVQTIPDKKMVSDLTSFPGFASFHKVISTIGNGGEDCGTLHAGYSHNYEASAATARIAYRPWTVSRTTAGTRGGLYGSRYYLFDSRLMEFLEDWSFGDVWGRREYQTYLQHISPAEESMENYLKDKFGLTPAQAKLQAKQIIEEIIGNWIQVPNGYDHPSDLYSVDYHPLNKALFERDIASAKSLIEEFSPRQYHQNENLNSFLINAVEWPAGVEMLLKADTNQNKQEGFGKTPLMMAAHMNRPDTVQLLLRHGANPNLKTSAGGEFCASQERGLRTALMYAAENASPQVMTLLLDAGADPLAVDSQNNGISFYLSKNPRLTETEKKMDIRTLTQSRKDRPLPSAFDCKKATQRVEKLICQNEVLMMYESEMSDAYSRFAKLAGAQVKQDQLRWIKDRKKACIREDGDKEQELGCLQQLVSTRGRYLHNRLAEYERN